VRARFRTEGVAATSVSAAIVNPPAATVSVRRRAAAIVAVLLVAAVALLFVGVLLERHSEPGNAHPTVSTGEQQEGHPAKSAERPHPEAAERFTGVNLESPGIVTVSSGAGEIEDSGWAVVMWLRSGTDIRYPRSPLPESRRSRLPGRRTRCGCFRPDGLFRGHRGPTLRL
jgi:hypothetical protein